MGHNHKQWVTVHMDQGQWIAVCDPLPELSLSLSLCLIEFWSTSFRLEF